MPTKVQISTFKLFPKDVDLFIKWLIPGTVVFTVCYNIPKFFEITTVVDPETNLTAIVGTEMRQNPLYMSLYLVWSKIILTGKVKMKFKSLKRRLFSNKRKWFTLTVKMHLVCFKRIHGWEKMKHLVFSNIFSRNNLHVKEKIDFIR